MRYLGFKSAIAANYENLINVYTCFMLWSQIKLTSYDFSDVHITGEFDNCPVPVRCPAYVILPSSTLPNAVLAPWNFK